jgi:hypothetical protein
LRLEYSLVFLKLLKLYLSSKIRDLLWKSLIIAQFLFYLTLKRSTRKLCTLG